MRVLSAIPTSGCDPIGRKEEGRFRHGAGPRRVGAPGAGGKNHLLCWLPLERRTWRPARGDQARASVSGEEIPGAEMAYLEALVDDLTSKANPALEGARGIGSDIAAAAVLFVAAGDNPKRLKSEASFAALCGVSPVQASSGKTTRHRLNRSGNRQAKSRTLANREGPNAPR